MFLGMAPRALDRLRGFFLDPSPQTDAMITSSPWGDLEAGFYGPFGNWYMLADQTGVLGGYEIGAEFSAYCQRIYRANPIAFACIVNRMALFSEARFKYRRQQDGRPGKLFGDSSLSLLEKPWPGATTANLLTIAEAHVSLAGNFFAARRNSEIRVLRPDWTYVVLGTDYDIEEETRVGDLDATVVGYIYNQGGYSSPSEAITLLREEVAHYMPVPDPECWHRGMSWLTPVIREIQADQMATMHKERYWQNGGTPNMVVKPAIDDIDEWDKWVEKFREKHEGIANKFKTLFLMAGIDATVLGKDMNESAFVEVQSAGEVRIVTASQVPPAIVSVNKGLQGSALNAGNFDAAWRQFANGWARPAWRGIAGALQNIVDSPDGAELWYDDRDIAALQEDIQKQAEAQAKAAETIRTLVDAGFEPDTVVDAVIADDFSKLEHSGRVPVQVRGEPAPSENGHRAVELEVSR